MLKFEKNPKTKFIFVSGGVISGVGKGTASASITSLLTACGLKVFPIKVDMYLNIDAGTMNPLEHGETFVTDDGLECDQDIGTYERFLNRSLNRNNYFTAGQVYYSILQKERQLKYNGACVEAYPHVPLEVIEFINRYPKDTDIVIIEYGGTVGEYQNEAFFEAARMIATKYSNDVCFIHVGYILQPKSLGELKSKPMQMSITELNKLGIFPDMLICRSQDHIDKRRIAKIANAAGLMEDKVFSCPDVDNIYKIPLTIYKQGVLKPIFDKLGIVTKRCVFQKWEKLNRKFSQAKTTLKIGMVTKYYTSGDYCLKDSYISVLEAIEHASWKLGVKPEIVWLDSEKLEKDPEKLKSLKKCDAVIVPQGWGKRGSEGKIKAIEFIRKNKIPYLGLCYGMQMASIEFGRNVVKLKNANSEEVDPSTPYPVIHIMNGQKKYMAKKQYGGTIRKGAWPCKIQSKTILEKLYKKYDRLPKNQIVSERHRHRYEFNNDYKERLENKGFVFSGLSPDGKLVEAIELPQGKHPFFVATQFHPELISRPLDPHPLFLGLLAAAKKSLNK